MKYAITILILLFSLNARAQGVKVFGATRPEDTSKTYGQLVLSAYGIEGDTAVLVALPNGTVKKISITRFTGGEGGSTDTTSLSDRIDTKLTKGGDSTADTLEIGSLNSKPVKIFFDEGNFILMYDGHPFNIVSTDLAHLDFVTLRDALDGDSLMHFEVKDINGVPLGRLRLDKVGDNGRDAEWVFAAGDGSTMPDIFKIDKDGIHSLDHASFEANVYVQSMTAGTDTDSIALWDYTTGQIKKGKSLNTALASKLNKVDFADSVNNYTAILSTYFKDTLITSTVTETIYGLDGNSVFQMGDFGYSMFQWDAGLPTTTTSLVIWWNVNNPYDRDTMYAPFPARHAVPVGFNVAKDTGYVYQGDLVNPGYTGDDLWGFTQNTTTGRPAFFLLDDNVSCLQRVLSGHAYSPRGQYLIGGQKVPELSDTLFRDVWLKPHNSNTFVKLSDNQPILGNISTNCIYHNGYVYIFSGGFYASLTNDRTYSDTIWRMKDDGLGIIEYYDTIPYTPRQYPCVSTYGDYIVWGFGATASTRLNDLWLYKPEIKEHSKVVYSPSIVSTDAPGFGEMVDSFGRHSLIMVGGSANGSPSTQNTMIKIWETGLPKFVDVADTTRPTGNGLSGQLALWNSAKTLTQSLMTQDGNNFYIELGSKFGFGVNPTYTIDMRTGTDARGINMISTKTSGLFTPINIEIAANLETFLVRLLQGGNIYGLWYSPTNNAIGFIGEYYGDISPGYDKNGLWFQKNSSGVNIHTVNASGNGYFAGTIQGQFDDAAADSFLHRVNGVIKSFAIAVLLEPYRLAADSGTSGANKYVTPTGVKTIGDALYQPIGSYLTSANIEDAINNGTTDKAPSENAVFDALALKEPNITATTSADYYRGDKTFQALNKAAVGLGNVDNTSDANKPVSTAQQTALDLKVDETTTVNGHALSSNVTVTADDVLPTQTGNSGKYLTTNGTTASWDNPAGAGTVTDFVFTDGNGFDGTVTNSTSTPTLVLDLQADNNFVTDAQLVVIGNTSGTNTGDQTTVIGNAGSATTTAITDDASTNATMYPTWVTTTTGNLPQKVSSTKLTFNPSTGNLSSTVFTGNLTGNVTGNVSGTAPAGSLTGTTLNATVVTSSLTSVGTLTGLTMGGTLAMGSNNITMTGSLAATGSRVTKGWFTDIESTNVPTVGGTALPTATSTTTFTNKRITKRIGTTASSSTPTPDADANDVYTVTALAAGATFGAPSGTPTDGQGLIIRIKDNGTARTLAFNAIYRFSTDITAPTTTVISKTMYLGFIYNSADSKWDCVAKIDNF